MVGIALDLKALHALHSNDILFQGALKTQLRAAGIPVVGVLGIESVESGRLTISYDEVFGETTYEWTNG